MKHIYSHPPGSPQKPEQKQSRPSVERLVFESRIDAGEKILPPVREQRHVHRLGLRLIFALVSLVVLALISQVHAPSNFHLIFACFTLGSINVIANMLLDRLPGKPHRICLLFAIISGLLALMACSLMTPSGENSLNIGFLVLIITLSANIIFYLLLCEKRRSS